MEKNGIDFNLKENESAEKWTIKENDLRPNDPFPFDIYIYLHYEYLKILKN